MGFYNWKKTLVKGIKAAVSTGLITGVSTVSIQDVDTSEKALITSVITVASFLVTSFLNWRKHK